MKRVTWIVLLGVVLLGACHCYSRGKDKRLRAGGSSFIYPMMSKWADDYKKLKGVEVSYQSIGSGGGIQGMNEGTFDFACFDLS